MKKIKTIGLIIFTIVITTAFTTPVDLELKSLLNNKVQLKIPKDFTIMPEEMIKVKYPSQSRPSLVYTNEPGSINVTVNLTNNQANQQMMPSIKDSFVKSFKSMHPTADWKDSGLKTINGKKVAYIELVTPAMDTQIYNLIFITDFNGKLLICSFNCTKKDITEWTPIAKEIMNSLKTK